MERVNIARGIKLLFLLRKVVKIWVNEFGGKGKVAG